LSYLGLAGGEATAKERSDAAEGWKAVAEGQTEACSAEGPIDPTNGCRRNEASNSELRNSPTRTIIHEGFNPHFV